MSYLTPPHLVSPSCTPWCSITNITHTPFSQILHFSVLPNLLHPQIFLFTLPDLFLNLSTLFHPIFFSSPLFSFKLLSFSCSPNFSHPLFHNFPTYYSPTLPFIHPSHALLFPSTFHPFHPITPLSFLAPFTTSPFSINHISYPSSIVATSTSIPYITANFTMPSPVSLTPS